MTSTTRAGLRVLALGALALLLSACIKVDMDLDVAPDNTVSGSAVLAVDQNLVELSGQTADQLFQDVDLSNLPPGATVTPYEDEGFVGQEVTFDDVPLSEFSGGQTLGGSGEDLSITRVGDEFHVAGGLDMSSAEFTSGQIPQGMLDNFEFRISITFPGRVTSSTGSIDGNTVTWEPRIGQNTEIRAVASAIPSGGTPWLTIALAAGGALLLAVILFLIMSRRRPEPAAGPIDDGAFSPASSAAIGVNDAGPASEPRRPPEVPPVSD
jgi:hypothetical protein